MNHGTIKHIALIIFVIIILEIKLIPISIRLGEIVIMLTLNVMIGCIIYIIIIIYD